MKKPRKKRGRKQRGKPFQKGFDPRRRAGFSREECRRGYEATRKKFADDVHKYAWFWRLIRSHYRAKQSWYPQSRRNSDVDDTREEERPGG